MKGWVYISQAMLTNITCDMIPLDVCQLQQLHVHVLLLCEVCQVLYKGVILGPRFRLNSMLYMYVVSS